ncbi:MAG: DUF2828 family protein [Oscillospiraceae bacterium]
MNSFLEMLNEHFNTTTTLNGAFTYISTESYCLDLFYHIGAWRNTPVNTDLVDRAYEENSDYTLRILFYTRDIRQGLGERKVFRIAMKHLAKTHPESVIKNLNLFSEYGRWDDLLYLYEVPSVKDEILNIVKKQLDDDIQNMNDNRIVSLLAKWLPSINASNNKTIALAKNLSHDLGMSYKEYRQTLTKLRKYMDIIENRLRIKDYSFDYEKQPSRAMLKYNKAFVRNDNDRYFKYLHDVQNGNAKMNTSTLYPYDIVRKILPNPYLYENPVISNEERLALDIAWKNLPDINNSTNSIAVIDGSGSMYMYNGFSSKQSLLPYQVAFSLGLYFAEHSKGAFANHFITFSSRPQLIEIKGNDIYEKLRHISSFNEVANTNIQSVFDLILNTAISNNLPQEELPENIYIISDMEFDSCVYMQPSNDGKTINSLINKANQYVGNSQITNFEFAKKKFEHHGYKLPNVIFWNVNSFKGQVPIKMHDSGSVLISGATPKLFDMVQSEDLNPMQLMLDIINSERYSHIFS